MINQLTLMLILLLAAPLTMTRISELASVGIQAQSAKIETVYDGAKNKTTIRLAPVLISAGQDKYVSLRMSPSFSFPGRQVVTPSVIDFELQTVVKGRLKTDLYVVFIIDGETVFLNSSRWGIKRPVPGRVWMGERLVFRMPYETLVKITKANTFEIKFDAVKFSVGEIQRQALRDFLIYMKPMDQFPAPSPYLGSS